jgi:hypothetical protein
MQFFDLNSRLGKYNGGHYRFLRNTLQIKLEGLLFYYSHFYPFLSTYQYVIYFHITNISPKLCYYYVFKIAIVKLES